MLTLIEIPSRLSTPSTIHNPDVDFNYITKIKLDVNKQGDPSLWVIYLYGTLPKSKSKRERLVAIWFFHSEQDQLSAIENILDEHLHVLIK